MRVGSKRKADATPQTLKLHVAPSATRPLAELLFPSNQIFSLPSQKLFFQKKDSKGGVSHSRVEQGVDLVLVLEFLRELLDAISAPGSVLENALEHIPEIKNDSAVIHENLIELVGNFSGPLLNTGPVEHGRLRRHHVVEGSHHLRDPRVHFFFCALRAIVLEIAIG